MRLVFSLLVLVVCGGIAVARADAAASAASAEGAAAQRSRRLLSRRYSRYGAAGPGALAAVSAKGVGEVLKSVEPGIEKALGHLKMKDIKVKKFKLHISNIRTQNFDCSDPCFVSSFGKGGAVTLAAKKFSLGLHMRFKYKIGFIGGGGSCDFKLKDSRLGGTAHVTASGGKFKLAGVDADVDIGGLNTGCKGISGAVINVVGDVFKKQIKDLIEKTARSTISSLLETQVNKVLAGVSLDVSFHDGVGEAYFDPMSVDSSSDHLAIELRGLISGPTKPSPPPGLPGPSVPPKWDSGHDTFLQLFVSDWTLSTLGYTYFAAGHLRKTIPHTVVPPSIPIALNTTTIALLTGCPGLVAKFPGMWMQLEASITQAPGATISAGDGVVASGPIEIAFQALTPSGPVTAFALGSNVTAGINFGVSVKGDQQTLTGGITKLHFDLALTKSTVGEVHAGALVNLTNWAVNGIGLPAANKFLAKGFALPAVKGLALKNTKLQPVAGNLELATDFSYSG